MANIFFQKLDSGQLMNRKVNIRGKCFYFTNFEGRLRLGLKALSRFEFPIHFSIFFLPFEGKYYKENVVQNGKWTLPPSPTSWEGLVTDPPSPVPVSCLVASKIFCRHEVSVRDTKNVSDFSQKYFMSATNLFRFAQHRNKFARLPTQEASSATMCLQQCVLLYRGLKTSLVTVSILQAGSNFRLPFAIA